MRAPDARTPSARYGAFALLRDGRSVLIRAIRPDDKGRLLEHFHGLSERSVYQRFFGPKRTLSEAELTRLTEVDFRDDAALAATVLVDGQERFIGVGRYLLSDRAARRAEVAFAVLDEYQGRGVGTLLLEHLAAIARASDVRTFEADALYDNAAMIAVFTDAGLQPRRTTDGGVVHFTLETERSAALAEASAARERAATQASLTAILAPRAVAVVGASRRPEGIGRRILANLQESGFRGPIYPIHPTAPEIAGLRAYPSLAAVGAPIDLAVLAVPVPAVEAVVADAARAHVRGLTVISAGFAETSPAGRALEQRIRDLVRGSGMRMVGPNCLGVLSTDPAAPMNVTFAATPAQPGNVAMASQSGAIGLALLDHARAFRFGLSAFVSVGNKADISGNDLLLYWADDPRTRVAALYLESFGNPRKFARIAREVGRKKPVVALKAGRSSAGRRAAMSHSAALASSDIAAQALFEQSGVIRTDTMEEMLEVIDLLAAAPLPAGPRVAVVTNAGGPGILFADACEAGGLSLPVLDADVQARLASFLPAHASRSNPVDMIASATPEQYARAIATVGACPEIDAVVAIHIPVEGTAPGEVAAAIARGAGDVPPEKPVLAVLIASGPPPGALDQGPRGTLPSYTFPENAARALARAVRYARWRSRPEGRPRALPEHRRLAVRKVIDQALAEAESRWLAPGEAEALLAAAGIPFAPSTRARPEDAAEAAEALGFPVVAKGVVGGGAHKTELGLVRVGLESRSEVDAARAAIDQAARAHHLDLEAILIQRQIAGGLEAIAGIARDPTFGPLVVAGMGGVQAEALRDVALGLTPLTDVDATEMIAGLRMRALLDAYRGAPPRDRRAFGEVILQLSALAEAAPEIVELDLNPLMIMPEGGGAIAVDVRVRVARPGTELPTDIQKEVAP